MRFVWDSLKNHQNIRKHGIDFADVSSMFEYPLLANVDTRKNYEEERWVAIGFLKGIIAVIVYFEDDENEIIRIISARKATKYEQDQFKQKIRN
jgi:uncharacterized protein